MANEANGIRVLLVEDNPGDARLLRETLAGAGTTRFVITHVDRLAEAVARLARERFDVVLLDLHLPDSSGLETFSRAHENAPGAPIVVLTGLDDEDMAIRAVQAGAQDYLIKGQVPSTLLVRALRYAMERIRREQVDLLRKSQTTHLWRSLLRTMGRGASAILYRGGVDAGAATYDFIRETWKPRTDEEFVASLGEYLRAAGLCSLREFRVQRETRRVSFLVEDNFEVMHESTQSPLPLCHFLRGMLCGIALKLLDFQEMVCDEISCEATGSDICEFLAYPQFSQRSVEGAKAAA